MRGSGKKIIHQADKNPVNCLSDLAPFQFQTAECFLNLRKLYLQTWNIFCIREVQKGIKHSYRAKLSILAQPWPLQETFIFCLRKCVCRMLVIHEEIRVYRSLCPTGNKYGIIFCTKIFPKQGSLRVWDQIPAHLGSEMSIRIAIKIFNQTSGEKQLQCS